MTNPQLDTKHVEVLIIGAGPVGLTAAIQLRTHGVEQVCVVDCGERPSLTRQTDFSRAIGVHARTLEHLEDVGLADELASRGTLARTGSYFYNERMMYRLDYHTGCDHRHIRYNWNLMVTQANTIDVLLGKNEALGQDIDWQTELVSFEQDAEGVTAKLRDLATGDERLVRARWLLGADGAHSKTRKTLGIDFPGHVYPVRWVVCDLTIDWDIPHDDIAFIGTRDAFAVTLPLKGWGDNRYRVTMIQPVNRDDPGMASGHAIPTDTRRFTRADCVAFFKKIYSKAKVSCPDDAGRWFMVHCRLASRYRQGRCFLLGDAAHIHSPILGQGMNTGIQDATNLAWKLALVARGHAPRSLLDTYEIERRAIAEEILRFTDRTTRLVILRSSVLQYARGYLLNYLLRRLRSRRFLISKLMQLLISYRNIATSLTQDAWAPERKVRRKRAVIAAGDRVPDPCYPGPRGVSRRLFAALAPGRFNVLFFVGIERDKGALSRVEAAAKRVRERYGKFVSVLVVKAWDEPECEGLVIDSQALVHEVFDAAHPCVYVLRPDRHVGLRTHELELAGDYLRQIFSTPTREALVANQHVKTRTAV